jgi:hypothetical protein
MLRRLARLFGARSRYGTEADVDPDSDQARIRETGGKPGPERGDDTSTTGTAPNDVFVGRVAGDDLGYAGETGAEKRSGVADSDSSSDTISGDHRT